MTKPNQEIANCLNQTQRAHAKAFPGGRRADPAWGVWYAEYLLQTAGLLEYTNRHWKPDELAEALIQLDSAYFNGSQNQPWHIYAAARLSF
jgi:hypothetical protein